MVRSQEKLQAIQQSFSSFEAEIEKSQPDQLKRIRQIRRTKDRRPYADHNLNVTKTRKEDFNQMRKQIREFRDAVDERKQPHVRVYEMSMAARARAREGDGDQIALAALDVPQPDLKFRLEADVLGLRLEAMFLEDQMEFLARLVVCGCKEEAHEQYGHLISKCQAKGKSAEEHRMASDGSAHYRTAIEFLLLQLHFVSLERRSSVAISVNAKIENLTQRGLKIIERCEGFIQKHPSCAKTYQAAVANAKQRFTNGEFHAAVTAAERKAIATAMQAEFSGTGHWYTCRNGHPVILHHEEANKKFTVGECGMPMERARCPECGEPVGGQSHQPAEGVSRTAEFDNL